MYREDRPAQNASTLYKLYETVPDYFSGVVLQRHHLNESDPGVVTLKFQVAFNLAVVWMIVFVSLSKGIVARSWLARLPFNAMFNDPFRFKIIRESGLRLHAGTRVRDSRALHKIARPDATGLYTSALPRYRRHRVLH